MIRGQDLQSNALIFYVSDNSWYINVITYVYIDKCKDGKKKRNWRCNCISYTRYINVITYVYMIMYEGK
jgi:hypothetical protein